MGSKFVVKCPQHCPHVYTSCGSCGSCLFVCSCSLLVKRTSRSSGYRPDCEHSNNSCSSSSRDVSFLRLQLYR